VKLKKWIGYVFESSSSLTPEFAAFAKDMKSFLKNEFKDFELVSFSRMHFEFSCFFRNRETGKLAYVSVCDVRYWPGGWYEDMLVRTAKHDKDYTGGANCRCRLSGLGEMLAKLTK
jgi:hypothetical protein